MISKKTLKEIADHVINYGLEQEGVIIHILSNTEWEIMHRRPKGNNFFFVVPSYEDEHFVEDKKTSLMLDLYAAYTEWLRLAPQRKTAERTNAIIKKKNPNHYREAAKKRWAKTKS